jgi:hypothetical protein
LPQYLFDLGGLPERPMGGDCKSPGSAFEGSNPSPATIFIVRGIFVNPHTFEGSNPSAKPQ